MLVATQAQSACKADDVDGGGVESDPEGLLSELQHRYETDLIIEPQLFVVDSSSPAAAEMTALKRALADIKQFIVEVCIPYNISAHLYKIAKFTANSRTNLRP